MLLTNRQAKARIWPFVECDPPVILDWLPSSHTFGANRNFNLILRHGGTLVIDTAKPTPGAFQRTLDNLAEIQGNIYFNAPRGFDMLVAALEENASLRDRFFERLRAIFYPGAAPPRNLQDDLGALSIAATGEKVVMVSA